MRIPRLRTTHAGPSAPPPPCDAESVVVPTHDTRRPRSPSRPPLRPSPTLSPSLAANFAGTCLFACRACCCTCWCLRVRRQHIRRWYRWLSKRRLVWVAVAVLVAIFLLTLGVCAVLLAALTWKAAWTQRHVAPWLQHLFDRSFSAVVPGALAPREPARLRGLRVVPRTPLTADVEGGAAATSSQARLTARLEALYGDSLLLYTFVNGTEPNHVFRRLTLMSCRDYIHSVEVQLALNGAVTDGQGTVDVCTTAIQRAKTNAEVLAMVAGRAGATVTTRDRETDELRHSLRSVEQHMQWHRGRVVMVSPGHHPTWVDGAKNFLSGMCGGAAAQEMRSRGAHLRVTTVHQDALMPTYARPSLNTNAIEQQLWRVRNITPVHVYMNDDYFVNRDVAITDLFNEYGGTIVRTESGLIAEANTANVSARSWAAGVSSTNFFATEELDLRHEDEIPAAVVRLWQQQEPRLTEWDLDAVQRGVEPLPEVRGPDPRSAMFVLLESLDTEPPQRRLKMPEFAGTSEVLAAYASREFGVLRPRFFATHAPFVYCTNMLRFFALRFQREFARSAVVHRSRSAVDLYIPFLYNAFIMARPWQASPRFPAYMTLRQKLAEEAARASGAPAGVEQHANASVHALVEGVTLRDGTIILDNCDGCAPATMLVGPQHSGALFGAFSDDTTENADFVAAIRRTGPLFFNVNAGLTKPDAAAQLRQFLREKFPTPSYLETHAEANSTPLSSTFDALMALPVVGLVSYEEGACPLVRSLALAFAGHHRGPVRVSVQRHGEGEVDPTLEEVREDLHYMQQSAMTTAACSYADHVTVMPSRRGEALEALAARVLKDISSGAAPAADPPGVALPSTCGRPGGAGGGDGAAPTSGMRVRGFLVDARTPGVPIRNIKPIATALAVPAQTLALEDFRAVRVGPAADDVVLVLSRGDAAARAVHWVAGASESDLLVTYPLPVAQYENMSADARWHEWRPPKSTAAA